MDRSLKNNTPNTGAETTYVEGLDAHLSLYEDIIPDRIIVPFSLRQSGARLRAAANLQEWGLGQEADEILVRTRHGQKRRRTSLREQRAGAEKFALLGEQSLQRALAQEQGSDLDVGATEPAMDKVTKPIDNTSSAFQQIIEAQLGSLIQDNWT